LGRRARGLHRLLEQLQRLRAALLVDLDDL
jgi:hypothetical protein